MKDKTSTRNGTPTEFIAHYGDLITGMISGFDRMRFMGTIRTMQSDRGLLGYLNRVHVLVKEFRGFSLSLTDQVRNHAHTVAEAAGKKVRFLQSSSVRKDELARSIAEQEGTREGLIGIFSATEPCKTYFVRRNRETRCLDVEFGPGKCLHLYYYFLHAEYGLMHLRLQTWFPFNVTICLNGREWLARQMERAGIGYIQKDNCFLEIADAQAAQALADEQLKTDWPQMLDGLLRDCHPIVSQLCAPIHQSYYWSLKESEYATDFMFRSPEELSALYPRFLRHGMQNFGSPDVLRFLSSKGTPLRVHGNFEAELNTSLKRRPEGVRIKHFAAGNSIKLYDKEGQVLRVETTINHPEVFRVYRRPERQPEEEPRWMVLRKGVADTHRRAQLSKAANLRYSEALARTSDTQPAGEAAETIFKRVCREKRRYRALNPWTKNDAALLECVNSGAWLINGFRNRDVRTALFGDGGTKKDTRRDAARVTRLLALLRAHHVIRKIAGTHRYQVTDKGRQIITALQNARLASTEELSKIAA